MDKQKGQQPGSRERQEPFQPEKRQDQPGSGFERERQRDEHDQDND